MPVNSNMFEKLVSDLFLFKGILNLSALGDISLEGLSTK